MRFLDVFIHQAHPGGLRHHYETFEDKLAGAVEYKAEEALPWPMLVDDLAGTTHNAYSNGMADPVFLIDTTGLVSFYGMWTHPPTLRVALDELLARGGQGVAVGLDRTPHLLASFVDGYRGPRRGGRRAVLEYDLGAFGAGSLSFIGHKAKRLLSPVALRSTPLPPPTRFRLLLGLVTTLVLAGSLIVFAVRWAD
ncbi:MAG: hypothetical protein H0T70_00685 [Acidimicrobiia bacterium]|nr:hypothetical protein [Acidimicrobiia bacterium]